VRSLPLQKAIHCDEVAILAPRGRDSIAQGTNLSVGAPALGWSIEKRVKPQGGEIPSSMPCLCGHRNLAPSGLNRNFEPQPRAKAPWAIESRPLWGLHGIRWLVAALLFLAIQSVAPNEINAQPPAQNPLGDHEQIVEEFDDISLSLSFAACAKINPNRRIGKCPNG